MGLIMYFYRIRPLFLSDSSLPIKLFIALQVRLDQFFALLDVLFDI